MGLAIATTIAAFVNSGMLFVLLKRQGVYRAAPGWAMLLRQIAGGLIPMILILLFVVQGIEAWFEWRGWQRLLWLFIWVSVAALVYFAGLYLSGFRLSRFRSEHSGRD
jgi:putative peptidoglycan lipid II flippase